MRLNDLKPGKGSKHSIKRLGRGAGSGHGGTSTRGHNGQNSRSGGGVRLGFEGGQMPLIRRIPKRGFINKYRKLYEVVNLGVLDKNFNDNDTITPELLMEKGITNKGLPVKVLGEGDTKKKLNVKAAGFTESAKNKILAAKGTVEVIEWKSRKNRKQKNGKNDTVSSSDNGASG